MSSLNEFELIARYFTRPSSTEKEISSMPWLRQGIGDDCAILNWGSTSWAITTDLLVEGTHFFPDVDPHALGHKALAVNLSDLAAAGAQPRCFFLALALPQADEIWLEAFSSGLFALADEHQCVLVGGDSTRAAPRGETPGPITVCITALGQIEKGQALSRAAAAAGDDLWVSGELGGAALALQWHRDAVTDSTPPLPSEPMQACVHRLERPQPRVLLGQALREKAHAAIDVSDGLLADLGHLCTRSEVGATVHWETVPRAQALARRPVAQQQACALAGGDDYELLFTAPVAARAQIEAAARDARTPVTRIGVITHGREVVVLDGNGERIHLAQRGFDHFA